MDIVELINADVSEEQKECISKSKESWAESTALHDYVNFKTENHEQATELAFAIMDLVSAKQAKWEMTKYAIRWRNLEV